MVDALGSAYVTEHPDGLHHLEGRCVLTVNPTELARTLRIDDEDVQRDPVGATMRLARQAQRSCSAAAPARSSRLRRGKLAGPRGRTGPRDRRSGDVQAGFVTGLLARGAEPAQAALWAAYLHAAAGDRLAAEIGPLGFLARELPAVAPRLLADLTAGRSPDLPPSVETELVALDVLHHDARLVVTIGRQ